MRKVLDSYNEVGVVRPFFNRLMRIGLDYEYWAYRSNWWLVNKLHYVTKFPIHIDIEATNFCNLKCTMCPHGLENYEMKKGYFDFGLYKRVLKECGVHGLRSIKLNMRGEPLLHKKLIDMVAIAKEAGILEVMFNTNGLLLTPQKTRDLIEAGLDLLIVSIDGATKETYEKIRVGGDFDLLNENLEYFIRYRKEKQISKPLIRLQFVAMKDNVHESEDYVRMWRNKVDVITVNRYSDRGCGSEKKAFEMVPNGRANCYHPWRRMSVNWDGDAQMCCGDWDSLCILGNVSEKGIYELWHSKLFNEYRKKLRECRLDEIPCCKDCFVLAGYKWEKKLSIK